MKKGRICRHIRRWDPMPRRGRWILRCDCGWGAEVEQLDGTRHRGRREVDEALNGAFLAHLGANERRTYLLLDTRPPPGRAEVEEFEAAAVRLGEPISHEEAVRRYAEQPEIVGNFVMPESLPVQLVATRVEHGVHYGSFRLDHEPLAELPIGEVRTPDGKVYRLDE